MSSISSPITTPTMRATCPMRTGSLKGCSHGWVLLTKDKRIRYRAEELEALQEGHLFCLVSGNLDIEDMTQAFLDALPKIERVARDEPVGFWHVYRDGQIKRMWP